MAEVAPEGLQRTAVTEQKRLEAEFDRVTDQIKYRDRSDDLVPFLRADDVIEIPARLEKLNGVARHPHRGRPGRVVVHRSGGHGRSRGGCTAMLGLGGQTTLETIRSSS